MKKSSKKQADRAKKRQRREQKKRAKAVKRTVTDLRTGESRTLLRRPISDTRAPRGFRACGHAQSMMEIVGWVDEVLEKYRGPVESEMEDLNLKFQIAQNLWNLEMATIGDKASLRKEILDLLSGPCDGKQDSALEEILALFRYRCPVDVQPKNSPYVFIRNEDVGPIDEVDDSAWPYLSEEELNKAPVFPPSGLSKNDCVRFVEHFTDLDLAVEAEADYEDYEKDALAVEDLGATLYSEWLRSRGLSEQAELGGAAFHLFSTFVYRYDHDYPAGFEHLTRELLWEFFSDYLLRKCSYGPLELRYFPSLLKLLGDFLSEMGLEIDLEEHHELFSVYQRSFINLLRERHNSTEL